jgi:hypothetical protein
MTTEGPSPEVAAFAAGIETASGGTVVPGLGWGWTSKIGDQMADYELSHRDGTGLDLDCQTADPEAIYAWAVTLDCVEEAVLLDNQVHVTLRPGSTVDLSGCPKPKKKKAAAEEAPVE